MSSKQCFAFGGSMDVSKTRFPKFWGVFVMNHQEYIIFGSILRPPIYGNLGIYGFLQEEAFGCTVASWKHTAAWEVVSARTGHGHPEPNTSKPSTLNPKP